MIRTELNFHGHREIRNFVRTRNTTIDAGYFGAVLSCGAPSGEDALVFSDAGPIGPVGDEYLIVRPVLQDLAVVANGDASDDEPYRVAVAFLTGNKNPDGFYRFESGDDLSENPYRAYEAALKGLYQSLVGSEDAWWPEDGVGCDDAKVVAKIDWEEDTPILIEGSDGEVREDIGNDLESTLLRLAYMCKRTVKPFPAAIAGIVAGADGHTVIEGFDRKHDCSGGMADGVDAVISTHFESLEDSERLVLLSDYSAGIDYAMIVTLGDNESDTHAFLKAAHQVLHRYGDKYKTYAVRERLFQEV